MAQYHLLLAALLQLLRITSGDGEMSLVLPETGYCGETISGTCTARDSTRLTLDISGLDSHTFTPEGSQKSVVLESVSLDLEELTPTHDKFMFVVSISYTLMETLTISCRNDKVNEIHKVLLQSGNCSSPLTYVADSSMIVWESPKCLGWEPVLVYTIRISTEGGVIERSTDKNSYVLPDRVKGVVNVSLSVENYCGETTQLDRQSVDTETTGTGGLAGGGGGSSESGAGELEKSLMVFFFIGLAPPVLLLMIVFIVVVVKKICSDRE